MKRPAASMIDTAGLIVHYCCGWSRRDNCRVGFIHWENSPDGWGFALWL